MWGDHWVRGLSPWHESGFPDEFKTIAPENGEQISGWFLEDHCGNQIAFISDGTAIEEELEGKGKS
jgi:hypothetical protein